MQYMVPQFTDVEDRIIGSLTIKQFGIIFGAGVLIFLAYQASKSIAVLVVFVVLFGLPAAGLAFAKVNGRELYKNIPIFIKFAFGPKLLIFHKEAKYISRQAVVRDARVSNIQETKTEPQTAKQRFTEINKILKENAEMESELVSKK